MTGLWILFVLALVGAELFFLLISALHRDVRHLLPLPVHRPDVWRKCVDFDIWDFKMRDALGPFAGLKILPTGGSALQPYLAYRHWPHLLCWQWILYFRTPQADEHRYFFRFHGRLRPSVHGAHSWTLHLFWLGYLHYQRQASDRIPALGPTGRDAPVIFDRPRDWDQPSGRPGAIATA